MTFIRAIYRLYAQIELRGISWVREGGSLEESSLVLVTGDAFALTREFLGLQYNSS